MWLVDGGDGVRSTRRKRRREGELCGEMDGGPVFSPFGSKVLPDRVLESVRRVVGSFVAWDVDAMGPRGRRLGQEVDEAGCP